MLQIQMCFWENYSPLQINYKLYFLAVPSLVPSLKSKIAEHHLYRWIFIGPTLRQSVELKRKWKPKTLIKTHLSCKAYIILCIYVAMWFYINSHHQQSYFRLNKRQAVNENTTNQRPMQTLVNIECHQGLSRHFSLSLIFFSLLPIRKTLVEPLKVNWLLWPGFLPRVLGWGITEWRHCPSCEERLLIW